LRLNGFVQSQCGSTFPFEAMFVGLQPLPQLIRPGINNASFGPLVKHCLDDFRLSQPVQH